MPLSFDEHGKKIPFSGREKAKGNGRHATMKRKIKTLNNIFFRA